MSVRVWDVDEVRRRDRKPRKKRVLVLAGGGYRGLFCSEFLSLLEEWRFKEIMFKDYFDLIVCTSTGSIIGAGILTGKSPGQISESYKALGASIFPGKEDRFVRLVAGAFRQLKRVLFRPPYSSRKLRDVLSCVLKEDGCKKLSGFDFPIVFTSVEYFQKRPFLLSSSNLLSDSKNTSLLDSVLASAAAPTFFPSIQIEEGQYTLVDGGIFANSPELVALGCAKRLWGCEPNEVVILSIGTSSPSPRTRPGKVKRAALSWLVPGKNDILKLILSVQEEHSRQIAKLLLLPDNYYIADGEPSPDEAKALTRMDWCSEEAEQVLVRLARQEFEEFKESSFAREQF